MGRKESDGLSFRVTVPENTTVKAGDFVLLDGLLGLAVQGAETGAGETEEIILNIEPCEYETDQIDTADDFNAGDKVYWDAANKRFTTVATDGIFAGIVTEAKDANDVIWFSFAPQQPALKQAEAQADSAAGDVAALVTDFNALLAKLRAANILAQ